MACPERLQISTFAIAFVDKLASMMPRPDAKQLRNVFREYGLHVIGMLLVQKARRHNQRDKDVTVDLELRPIKSGPGWRQDNPPHKVLM
jgi:hypothetical protein